MYVHVNESLLCGFDEVFDDVVADESAPAAIDSPCECQHIKTLRGVSGRACCDHGQRIFFVGR